MLSPSFPKNPKSHFAGLKSAKEESEDRMRLKLIVCWLTWRPLPAYRVGITLLLYSFRLIDLMIEIRRIMFTLLYKSVEFKCQKKTSFNRIITYIDYDNIVLFSIKKNTMWGNISRNKYSTFYYHKILSHTHTPLVRENSIDNMKDYLEFCAFFNERWWRST